MQAVEGDTYVKLNRGVLTVEQIDALFDSIPLEFSYIDSNNQFIYYNNEKAAEDMLAASKPESVGKPLGTLHPEKITEMVAIMVQQLRKGEKDVVRIGHPANGGKQFIVHNYQRIQDRRGNYLGVNEYVQDLKPMVEWYLKQTGQKLVPDDANVNAMPPLAIDALSGASEKMNVDDVSSASQNN